MHFLIDCFLIAIGVTLIQSTKDQENTWTQFAMVIAGVMLIRLIPVLDMIL